MSGVSAILGLDREPDRRRGDRHAVSIEAQILSDDLWCAVDCTIVDRSDHGAKLKFGLSLKLPSHFDLVIPSDSVKIPVKGIWRRGFYTGVEFIGAPIQLG